MAEKSDNDAGKCNNSKVRWAKIPGKNQGCSGDANERGPFGQAGIDDILEDLTLGISHERFGSVPYPWLNEGPVVFQNTSRLDSEQEPNSSLNSLSALHLSNASPFAQSTE